MRNKLIIGVLGLGVVVVGIASFAAFTAQIVNLEAHVEKEIEVAAVKDCVKDTVTGEIVCVATTGNYGTVIPQVEYEKEIEVTLSESFRDNEDQTVFGDVHFDALWECKQIEPEQDEVDNLTGDQLLDVDNDGDGQTDEDEIDGNNNDGDADCVGGDYDGLHIPSEVSEADCIAGGGDPVPRVDEDPSGDGFFDCRVVEDASLHNGHHFNDELDGRLRDFSDVTGSPTTRCELAQDEPGHTHADAKTPDEKDVEFIWHGKLNDTVVDEDAKCFYTVKLLAPPCEGEFNPATDPNFDPANPTKTIDCHFRQHSSDPQDWEHFADIGDEFKIQVVFHSVRTP